jgi:integrase
MLCSTPQWAWSVWSEPDWQRAWLIQNGADLSEVQDALGHATVQMTRRDAALAKGKTASRLSGILATVASGLPSGPDAEPR